MAGTYGLSYLSQQAGRNPDRAAAQLAQNEYARNVDMYRPLEDYLFDSLANYQQKTVTSQRSAIMDSNRNFEQGQEQDARQFKSFGIELDADQKKSLSRQYDIAAAKSAIDAANRTGTAMRDTRFGLLGGM